MMRLPSLFALAAVLLGASPAHVSDFDTSPLVDATIPVLVPTLVPRDMMPVHLTGLAGAPSTQEGGYIVVLGAIPDCEGYTACTYGQIEGEPTQSHRVPARYHTVKMRDGSTGYYINGKCGVNCAGSFKLQFFKGDAKYIISLKAGQLPDALLIEKGLRILDH